jgi:hypothetical protein
LKKNSYAISASEDFEDFNMFKKIMLMNKDYGDIFAEEGEKCEP